jgi:hypothetical protein
MDPDKQHLKTDLDDLGFVLFDCMEGHLLPADRRNRQLVQQQRKAYKVFGLTNAEKWSGSKQLMDFLDDIFSDDRITGMKFIQAVSFPTHI